MGKAVLAIIALVVLVTFPASAGISYGCTAGGSGYEADVGSGGAGSTNYFCEVAVTCPTFNPCNMSMSLSVQGIGVAGATITFDGSPVLECVGVNACTANGTVHLQGWEVPTMMCRFNKNVSLNPALSCSATPS